MLALDPQFRIKKRVMHERCMHYPIENILYLLSPNIEIKSGEIKGFKIGKRVWKIQRSEVYNYINQKVLT